MGQYTRSLVVALAVGVALTAAPGTASTGTGDGISEREMTVRVRQGRLMERPRMIGSRVLQVLPEGTVVRLRDPEQTAVMLRLRSSASGRLPFSWLKVQPKGGRSIGYLHGSTLGAGRVQLPSSDRATSSEEVAIAGRGFDERIEQRYRKRHPDLNRAFMLLDELENDRLFNPDPEQVTQFVQPALEEDML